MPRELRVLEVDKDHAMGTWGNMLIIVWRGITYIPTIERCMVAMSELIAAYPAGIGLLQVAEMTAKPPDGAVRAAVARMLASGRDHVTSSSLVYSGTGFWMAACRAFVTGLTLLSRPGFPHEVFATVDEAANWHARLIPRADGRFTGQREIADATYELTAILDRRFGPWKR
jgi:hypothetical protein